MSTVTSNAASHSGAQGPQRWWQWFFLYPTLAVALLTAAPEWFKIGEGWFRDIPGRQLADAKRQNELWRKNLDCTAEPMDFFENPRRVKVDATICRSGDVFVRVFTPDDRRRFHWVDVDALINSEVALDLGLVGTAVAAEPAPVTLAQFSPQQAFVMCQRFLDTRQLLRVVNVGGACFDEVVDTFTGQMTARSPSQCRTAC